MTLGLLQFFMFFFVSGTRNAGSSAPQWVFCRQTLGSTKHAALFILCLVLKPKSPPLLLGRLSLPGVRMFAAARGGRPHGEAPPASRGRGEAEAAHVAEDRGCGDGHPLWAYVSLRRPESQIRLIDVMLMRVWRSPF